MSLSNNSSQGKGRVLVLVADTLPWYMAASAPDRCDLEDEAPASSPEPSATPPVRARAARGRARRAAAAHAVSEFALRKRDETGGEVELVDAFEQRALAIAASAAGAKHAPGTRPPTSVRRLLRASYGEASVDAFTLALVAAWRDELTRQGSRQAPLSAV
jgi:hypothetical protein